MATSGGKKRRRLVDPRLVIGVALILGSIVGVGALVTSLDTASEVYAARTTLTPGEKITASDLVLRQIRFGDLRHLYLGARDLPGVGAIVARPVSAGELVPRSAVGSRDGDELTSVVLNLKSTLPTLVQPGSTVDLWSARQVENGVYDAPSVLVESAIVSRIVAAQGIVVDSGGASVELLIPRDDTARVLEAIANDASLSVVPDHLPVKG